MEERNKLAIEKIESQAENRDKILKDESEVLKNKLKSDTNKAKRVLNDLTKEIEEQAIEQSKILEQTEELTSELYAKKSHLDDLRTELETVSHKLTDNSEEVNSLLSRKENLLAEIKEAEDSRTYIKEDLEVLNNEAETVENKVIELDAQFKARKKYLDGLLSNTQLKLKEASDSLQEAQNKDKTMREGWAEEQMKLDKREQTVRRMEAKVSDAESRIEELQRYDRL